MEQIGLVAILAAAAFLDCFRLGQNGYGNTYYATAVKSMLMNWHNFFYVSFDPGGFVSIDKPPVGLWIQVLFAKIFGFSGLSLILPEAIAGVVSVYFLYAIVRRMSHSPAALLAAGALAISPINVVANRDDILDSLLVMTSLGAAWALLVATERASLSWLSLSAILLGLGFNIKMLEGFMIVPALAVVYYFGALQPWRRRLGYLLFAGIVLLVVTLSWITIVDLTPAADRPYVGSSQNNSEYGLAFGYNGLERIFGKPHSTSPADQGPVTSPAGQSPSMATPTDSVPQVHLPWILLSQTAATEVASIPSELGSGGPLRLFQPELGGQITWFLPLALIGLLSSIWGLRPRAMLQSKGNWSLSPPQQQFILWSLWLLAMGIFFSFGVFFSAYYLSQLAPAISALAALGLVGLWRDYQSVTWRQWLLPAAIVATAGEQFIILAHYSWWNAWLGVTVLGVGAIAAAGLVGLHLVKSQSFSAQLPISPSKAQRIAASGMLMMLAAFTLSVAPILWTASSLRNADEGSHPISGPFLADNGPALTPSASLKLLGFLQNQDDPSTTFLVATVSTGPAVGIIFATGAPVMAMGGFSGSDPILTPGTLALAVAQHRVRFFLLPSSNLTGTEERALYPLVHQFKTRYTNQLTKWVAVHCRAVPLHQWSLSNQRSKQLRSEQLFDCSTPDPL